MVKQKQLVRNNFAIIHRNLACRRVSKTSVTSQQFDAHFGRKHHLFENLPAQVTHVRGLLLVNVFVHAQRFSRLETLACQQEHRLQNMQTGKTGKVQREQVLF